MLMKAKNLASQPFKPVSSDRIAAGFADGNAESRRINLVRSRIKTHYPLAHKALIHKHLAKMLAGNNPLRFTQKVTIQGLFPIKNKLRTMNEKLRTNTKNSF